jgi:hypothetical protein
MDRHRDVWLPSEENYLRAMYGWVPLSKIATELGRAEQAVNVRRLQLQLPAVRDRADVMTIGRFAEAVGLCRQAARRLARKSRFSHTMYEYNRPVTVVVVAELLTWLKDPINWQGMDVEKIWDESLRRVVEQAKGDRWLTMDEAGGIAGYSRAGLYRLVRRKQLPAYKGSQGQKGNEKWLIRYSDLQAFINANRAG